MIGVWEAPHVKVPETWFETRGFPITDMPTRIDALAGFKSYFVKLRMIHDQKTVSNGARCGRISP